MTSLGLSSTSDVITFDQNWHHLYTTSAGGKDLSRDAQIRVIFRLEPEICTKMLKKWSEKLRSKFAATTPGCSMAKIAHLDDTFLVAFLTASKPSRRSIAAAKRKEKEKKERRKRNSKNRKALRQRSLSPPKTFDFCACPSENVAKRQTSGTKTKLS